MKTLSVIIPCYNEASTIRSLIERVSRVSLPERWNMEVVIIDDGSKDGTREILEEYRNKFKLFFHLDNQGKGTAVKTGLKNASGDYLIIQDADLEYDPAEIPLLIRALERGQEKVIYGSRNLHHIKRKGMYIPRAGVWFITKQFNFLYGANLTDLWTGYKLFPKEVVNLFVSGGFEAELIFSANLVKNGYKIVEVPISHKPRTVNDGKKIKYRDGLKGIIALLREYVK